MNQRSNKPIAYPDEAASSADRKSGRIAFDADGRGIWEWQIDTGVFTRTVSEDQLMDLAATNLQIMEPPPHTELGVWPRADGIGARRDPIIHRPAVRSRKAVKAKTFVADGPVRRLLKRLTGSA